MKLTIHANVPVEQWMRVAGVAMKAITEGNPRDYGPRNCSLYCQTPPSDDYPDVVVVKYRGKGGPTYSVRLNVFASEVRSDG